MVDVSLKLGIVDGRATCTLEVIAEPNPVASERVCLNTAHQELKGTFKRKGSV
jgi:hypothetical protein